MLPVLMLFLIPVGGGIPAGVLLARTMGLRWPVTAGLYFVSDLILALAFASTGDMLYYAVIALTTLRLSSYLRDPNTTILVVLAAMTLVPLLVRYFRSRLVPCKVKP